MTRIDHAARSRSRMEKTLSSYETGEDAGAIVVALAALNDATLALVEQQRIANLIALMDSPRVGVKAGRSALDAICPGEPFSERTLTPGIAAALGIENAS